VGLRDGNAGLIILLGGSTPSAHAKEEA